MKRFLLDPIVMWVVLLGSSLAILLAHGSHPGHSDAWTLAEVLPALMAFGAFTSDKAPWHIPAIVYVSAIDAAVIYVGLAVL